MSTETANYDVANSLRTDTDLERNQRTYRDLKQKTEEARVADLVTAELRKIIPAQFRTIELLRLALAYLGDSSQPYASRLLVKEINRHLAVLGHQT